MEHDDLGAARGIVLGLIATATPKPLQPYVFPEEGSGGAPMVALCVTGPAAGGPCELWLQWTGPGPLRRSSKGGATTAMEVFVNRTAARVLLHMCWCLTEPSPTLAWLHCDRIGGHRTARVYRAATQEVTQ